MAGTPNNTSSPQYIVIRSRLNKGEVQLRPLPDKFIICRRPTLTPPAEKGSGAQKLFISRRHTTTGIEVKMETADAEESVKRETEEVTGERNMKKETATSSLTSAISEELLKSPLIQLEKCSSEKKTRTEESAVEKEIKLVTLSDHSNDQPVSTKLEPMSAEPTKNESPRVANILITLSSILQTSQPLPYRHITASTILRNHHARSMVVPTSSSPLWQRKIVRSYTMPLVPVTAAAASSSVFAVFQPRQMASYILTSDPHTSRTPPSVSQFPTTQSHILLQEIESSSTQQSQHVKPKPIIPPQTEPVNAMRKIFKKNRNSRMYDDDEMWSGNDDIQETLVQQASTSRTMPYKRVRPLQKLVSQVISEVKSTYKPLSTYDTRMSQVISEALKPQTTASCDRLSLQPKDTSETLTSQTTSASNSETSQTTFFDEELVAQATATCETSLHTPDETQATGETLTAIFEEDSSYHVTLDSVLHSNTDLWHGDEMDTLLSEHNLDHCLFNDDTPALFELIGHNMDIEDFTSTPPPEFKNQENLPKNIFDALEF